MVYLALIVLLGLLAASHFSNRDLIKELTVTMHELNGYRRSQTEVSFDACVKTSIAHRDYALAKADTVKSDLKAELAELKNQKKYPCTEIIDSLGGSFSFSTNAEDRLVGTQHITVRLFGIEHHRTQREDAPLEYKHMMTECVCRELLQKVAERFVNPEQPKKKK